eukprot:GGOE01044171.1.p3 GENE.GGOE01044171.1~~GGOE01044171.1.p3  ORF type:complete len:111 (-),score=41.20 GGOE01044171.1:206-538(-)
MLLLDITPQTVWQQGVWQRVRDCERDFAQMLLDRNPLHRRVRSSEISVTVTALDYRCLLLPFYMGHYGYGGRLYDVLVHGRTGQVSGQRPWLGASYVSSVQQYLKHSKVV